MLLTSLHVKPPQNITLSLPNLSFGIIFFWSKAVLGFRQNLVFRVLSLCNSKRDLSKYNTSCQNTFEKFTYL